jgi:hypothetical protein
MVGQQEQAANATETENTIQRFAEIAQPMILDRFGAASCVAATRVTLAVLRYLGISAEPCACFVAVFDPAFVAVMASEGLTAREIQDKPKSFQREFRRRHPDSNSIVIGDVAEDGTPFPAHTVSIVERKHLLDLTIGQATHEKSGIYMPGTLWLEISEQFVDCGATFAQVNGCEVMYQSMPFIDFYRYKPQWDKSLTAGMVEEILRRMKAKP